jgi:hypothetical protein
LLFSLLGVLLPSSCPERSPSGFAISLFRSKTVALFGATARDFPYLGTR